jgi:hypothetical protein
MVAFIRAFGCIDCPELNMNRFIAASLSAVSVALSFGLHSPIPGFPGIVLGVIAAAMFSRNPHGGSPVIVWISALIANYILYY